MAIFKPTSIKEDRYYSTNDFVSSNNLEDLADELFGKGWEPEDDVDQIQELCDSVLKHRYRVRLIEGLRSDHDIEVEEIPPQYIDHSRWIEIISNLATEVVEARYGEYTWEHVEGQGHMFTEEAQDDFNDLYDMIESVFRVSLNVRSDAELERKEVSDVS